MAGTDAIGYLAAGLALTTFCMRSMRALRYAAIASNLAFIVYGYCNGLMPVLVLHFLLLPVNIRRLTQLAASQTMPGAERSRAHGHW
jgi:CRP/FNR family cyclic AMP-dependent transcriptional regulator